MSRKGVSSATVDIIRDDARKGHTANCIQKHLRREGRGMRRTQLLAYVREFKGRKPKSNVLKYTPRKYVTKEELKWRQTDVYEKHIAIYSKVKGINKRYEVSGTGHELMDFLQDAVLHPPKRRIARVDAGRISDRREIDYSKEWDKRPIITS